MMKKITYKWLIKKDACPDGIRWFKRNYPDGLVITKRNMGVLVDKLLRRRKGFYKDNVKWDTRATLHFLIDSLTDHYSVFINVRDIELKDLTSETLLDAFWKEYEAK